MSFADWVDESRERFDHEPTPRAVKESVVEFASGALLRAQWAWMKTVGGPTVKTSLGGENLYFLVDSAQDLRRAQNAIDETPILDWLLRDIDEETVFWDIGAYHGHYSLVAASKGAETIAFEPYPDNVDRFRRNISLNGCDVTLRELGLSDEEDICPFAVNDGSTSEFRIDDNGEFEVPVVRGDMIHPRPDIVKIDVEGHEESVLDGMPSTLDSVCRIVVEVHDGVDPHSVWDRLDAVGLSVQELATDRSQTYLGGER